MQHRCPWGSRLLLPNSQVQSQLGPFFYLQLTSLYARNITAYLNQPHVQSILGIDPEHSNYTLTNWALNLRFVPVDTFAYRADHYLGALLERGVRALLYAGDTDYVGNHVSCACCLRRPVDTAKSL